MSRKNSRKQSKDSTRAIPFALNAGNNNPSGLFPNVNSGKRDITNMQHIDNLSENIEISKDETRKIIENIFKPEKVHINKKTGDTTIFFEDGKSKVYSMKTIIDTIESHRQDIIDRFCVTKDTYIERYINEQLIQDEYTTERDKVDQLVNEIYDELAEEGETQEQRKAGIKDLYRMLMSEDLAFSTIMVEFDRNNYQSVVEEDIAKQVQKIEYKCRDSIEELDKSDGSNLLYRYVNELINKNSRSNNSFTRIYGGSMLPDESVIEVINNILGRERIKNYIREYGAFILDRKHVISYLIGKQIIKEEEIKELINRDQIIEAFFKTKNKELLKYMDKNDIVILYNNGLIDLESLKRYADLKSILISGIEKNEKMKILISGKKSRIFSNTETTLIWEFFEKDYFSLEDIKALEKAGYINIGTVIKNYQEDRKRKIAAALGVIPAITDEKIHSFFTPDIVLRELGAGVKDDKSRFYNEDLKSIYAKFEDNLEESVLDIINDENKNDKKKSNAIYLSLYSDGFFSAETLSKSEISKEVAIKYCNENNCDAQILIEFFNNGILLQDEVYELCGDDFDRKVLELISKGMNPTIISGLYSTRELIEMVQAGNLDFRHLIELKSDIVTGLDKTKKDKTTLLEMYSGDILSYAELYDLADAGVISMEDANNIEEKYNLRKDIEKLGEFGLVNVPIDDVCSEKATAKTGAIVSIVNKGKSRSTSSRESIGIDRNPIFNFYKALGATKVIKVDPEKCPLFKDEYSLIIMEDKRIGFLESSNGRTYMLPLKIICEQRNNFGGELDIIGNSRSRSQFNQQKEYVRSTNHTRNWAINVLDKIAQLVPNAMSKDDVKEFKKTNSDLIEEIQMSYDDRKEQRR